MFTCCIKQKIVENVIDLRIRKPTENILVADEVICVPVKNILIPVKKEIIFDELEIISCVEKPIEEIINKFNIKELPPLPPSPKTPESVD
jgi:hypothetical protein